MKKHVIVFGLLFFNTFVFSQTNVFPTSGNVGIGTFTPTKLLEVKGGNYSSTSSAVDLALFRATNTTAIPANDNKLLISCFGGRGSSFLKLQNLINDSNKGFIRFGVSLQSPVIDFGYDTNDLMSIFQTGKIRIGNVPTPNGYKLFVEEGILTEKVKVAIKSTSDWSDYVFAADYNLMPLSEVEAFTKENNHLPNVLSAKEMVENGLDVASMDAKLLEKIEELTLYLIEQKKEIEKLKKEVNALAQKNK